MTTSPHTPYRPDDRQFLRDVTLPRWLLYATAGLAILYFIIITFWLPYSNGILFGILVAGQVYFLWQSLTFIYTVTGTRTTFQKDRSYTPRVDVFITVAGEPIETVEQTLAAATSMTYPSYRVTVLNDGYVAGKENWRDIEKCARRMGVGCITRRVGGGAKAGNINHAVQYTSAPFIAIFDADYQPHQDFLSQTVPYLADTRVGFVQTPQFYRNALRNLITSAAWTQQQLFYGPICKGKNRMNAATLCGTNMVLRRSALKQVGGMCADSIAEDLATGMFIHERGWRSVYLPVVLAEGLAPEDFLSYYKQQFRWARGALDVIFRYNLIFRSGLTIAQRVQYLSSVSYFLSGVVVVVFACIPLLFLYFGWVPFTISTMILATIFLPYIFLTLYTIQRASNFSFTFHSLAFSISMFNIHIAALVTSALRRKSAFSVTSKDALVGDFSHLVLPHLIYPILVAGGLIVGLSREGLSPSVVNNIAWSGIYIGVFAPFMYTALPEHIRHPIAAVAKQPIVRTILAPRTLSTMYSRSRSRPIPLRPDRAQH